MFAFLSTVAEATTETAAKSVITTEAVGILPMAVNFTFFIAYISMGAAFVFFLVQRNSVHEEYRSALTLSAIIVGIAAFHYFYMKGLYADYTLPALAAANASGGDTVEIIKNSFFGIINYRYMDWLVTTPLLVAKIPMAAAHGKKVGKVVTYLILFDLLMIVAGFIGEQYVTDMGRRLMWGTISTVGYLGIVYILFTTVKNMAKSADANAQMAVKWMSIFVITTWGIYPIGYLVPYFAPGLDLNIVHAVYNIGDQFNKIAPGVVLYIAGRNALKG
jgi:bacteriorhodopsin